MKMIMQKQIILKIFNQTRLLWNKNNNYNYSNNRIKLIKVQDFKKIKNNNHKNNNNKTKNMNNNLKISKILKTLIKVVT